MIEGIRARMPSIIGSELDPVATRFGFPNMRTTWVLQESD